MIDWSLAERIAAYVAGEPPRGPLAPRLTPAPLGELASRCEGLVTGYTRMRPGGPLPSPETVGRGAWTRANLSSARPMLDPVTLKIGGGLGPFAPAARTAAGTVIAAEIGVIVGYLGQRVLGQYELMLLDPDAPARLLFVGPNLEEAVEALEADPGELLTWVALHEVTHAVQFGSVPWLREHLAELLRSLLSSLEVSVDPARVLRLPTGDDVRALVDAVRGGDLVSLVTSPQQREIVDRVQTTMAVIEGHAEHVMDAVGREVLPSLETLRAAMERRRRTASALQRLLQKLIGLELKLRQYEQGKRFCDAVVESGGIEALNRVWQGPELLPTAEELETPETWLKRTHVSSATSAKS